jgi:hypothetical protein
MKHFLLSIALCMLGSLSAGAQQVVKGTVLDGKHPLAGVNVYLAGTLDGCLTDSLGRFSFTTESTDSCVLKASCVGYTDYVVRTTVDRLHDVTIKMRPQTTPIDEVVVTASNFRFGQGPGTQTMSSIDVVTTGSSCGDLVAALQSLPGSQRVGEDGKLYVRGGSSEECQTFINGMHVLQPYSTERTGSVVRGRFSPFLFKGINFSSGGYMGEYGQALSSVLSMNTTDKVDHDKLGVSASMLDWNLGGTKAFDQSSLSFNMAYCSLSLYNAVFGEGRMDWTRPYRLFSTESQYKILTSSGNQWKTYIGYDLTSFGCQEDDLPLSLVEHNAYFNSTYHASVGRHATLFAGVAQSLLAQRIKNALALNDRYDDRKGETHLKASLQGSAWKKLGWAVGAESLLRYAKMGYRLEQDYHHRFGYGLVALHADAKLSVLPRVYALASLRGEWCSDDHRFQPMPRLSLQYVPKKEWNISVTAGRYSQMASDEVLHREHHGLRQSTADHFIASMQYGTQKVLFRLETYYKRYRHLPLLEGEGYVSAGKGTSKGIDLYAYLNCWDNMDLTVAYSYNDSKRRWLDYPAMMMPEWASRHNLRFNARYTVGKLIFGLSDTFTSHRHVDGYTTPNYNSLDLSMTVLVNKRTIVYTSLSNLLNQRHVYGLKDGRELTNSHNRFFYIGIFLTLKGNKAYDVSNF